MLEREEHCRLLVFSERAIFAVFNHAHDFGAVPAPEFEVAADGFVDRSEDFAANWRLTMRNGWRLFIVAVRYVSAREKPGARSGKISGRDVVVHGIGDKIGRPVIGRGVGVNIGIAAADAQWESG